MPEHSHARIRHVLVLAHPASESFNASVVQTYCETVRACGQEVLVRDLYEMAFDPVLKDDERPRAGGIALSPDVLAEIKAIRGADIYTLVYPIWYAMPPAIMKGYIDRVLGAGVTPQEIQRREAQGVLNGRHMLSITTSGTRDIWLDEQGQIESLRMLTTHYLLHAFGMKSCQHLHLGGVVEGLSKRFVDQALSDVHERARTVCATLAAERHAASAPPAVADGS